LPEGFTRRSVSRYLRADEDDYIAILKGLGNECPGAIKIISPDDAPVGHGYEILSDAKVRELAVKGNI